MQVFDNPHQIQLNFLAHAHKMAHRINTKGLRKCQTTSSCQNAANLLQICSKAYFGQKTCAIPLRIGGEVLKKHANSFTYSNLHAHDEKQVT